MSEPTKLLNIQTLMAALGEAQQQYLQAQMDEERTRSVATVALNAVNEAQRAFDDAVENIRKTGPRNSDWGTLNKFRKTPKLS